MRVLLVSPGVWTLPATAGVENTIYHLSSELAKLGCEIDLVSDVTKNATFAKGVTIRKLHLPSALFHNLGFYGYALRYTIGQALIFLRTLGLLIKNKYDVIHIEGRLAAPFLLSLFKGGTPLVYRINDDPPVKGGPHYQLFRISYWLVTATARRAERTIIIYPEIKDYLVQRGVTAKKLSLIPDGIDTDVFKPQPQGKKDFGLFVGFLAQRKNVDNLLRAVARLNSPVHFVVVGDGPERNHLLALAQSLGIADKVNFTGAIVDPDKLSELYGTARFFCLPALSECGIPLVILEAMACGAPIIASKISAVPSVVQDGYNGFLVEPGDIDGLAQRMQVLFDSPELSKEMGESSAVMLKEERSFTAMAKSIFQLYEEMAEERQK
jgi:glycosyltransferase involved in cell wall biosynthesis